MTLLHRFHDGSVLKTMLGTDLIKIPIWQGNRIMDKDHANKIREAVGSSVELLDNGYRIVNYEEEDASGKIVKQSYLIDGQHRAHVLREHFINKLCEPDFIVVVQEKEVDSESEAITYFNAINNVKPQHWRTDPKRLVDSYIIEIERKFNTKTLKFIRPKSTCRPYLSAECLREVLMINVDKLEQDPTKIHAFVQRVVDINVKLLNDAPMKILQNTKESKYWERALEIKFMLAVDQKLKWLEGLIHSK